MAFKTSLLLSNVSSVMLTHRSLHPEVDKEGWSTGYSSTISTV